ncbi:hypothetical protein [Dokdonella sp.]|uniref:hypothetical protein n=1 Tax=Dokdonella sp. TaxID=2291710 RepID=UPI0025C0F574|nr:hypothetical protein [Dokdonella sp.]MBX3692959.1 hypothetical protein [Dokdonella sp.]MCW5568212.1 hypothetical protein [Dokdonella sp.]
MQILTRLIALTRGMQLKRQFKDIEKALEQLAPGARRQLAAIAMREFSAASKSEFPHLYATPPEEKYAPWGSGTAIGFERMKSDSLQVRLRGLALWLIVSFHETKDSPFPDQRELHRQVMRTLRTLKESAGDAPDTASEYFKNSPRAA